MQENKTLGQEAGKKTKASATRLARVSSPHKSREVGHLQGWGKYTQDEHPSTDRAHCTTHNGTRRREEYTADWNMNVNPKRILRLSKGSVRIIVSKHP